MSNETPHKKTCLWCNREFVPDPEEPARYCSDECSIDSKNLTDPWED